MIFEAKELIYKSKRDKQKKLLHIIEKYSDLFSEHEKCGCGPDDYYIDIRTEKELSQIINKDLHHITIIIDNLKKEGLTDFIIRHCYTPDGLGYYSICDSDKKYLRFVKSDYRLTITGAAWSYKVWRKVLSADVLLVYYLNQIKGHLKKRYKTIKMDIRHLYLPYIIHKFDQFDYYEDNKIHNNINDTITEYLSLHQHEYQEYQEYQECRRSSLKWYNSDANVIYYVVEDILHRTVNDIYKYENDLLDCNLWSKANKIKDILYDIIYKRGDFTDIDG